MMKRAIKRLFEFTPYTIVRRQVVEGDTDPLSHNTPEGMDRLFSDGSFLHRYKSQKRQTLYETILQHIAGDQLKVADFGCGPGFFLKCAIEALPLNSYVGYEYSGEAVRVARESLNCHDNVRIEEHDIQQPVNEMFDVVICSQTLEHIRTPETALLNIINALRAPGGLAILSVPDGRIDRYKGHINFWSKESWDAWLRYHINVPVEIDHETIPNKQGFAYLLSVIKLPCPVENGY